MIRNCEIFIDASDSFNALGFTKSRSTLPSPIRWERVAEGRVRVPLRYHHRPATFIYAPRT
jgi:hypothetical protein